MSALSVSRHGPGLFAIRDSRFNPTLVETAKLVPGMSWDPVARAWVGYADAVALTLELLNRRGIRASAPDDIQRELIEPQSFYETASLENSVSGKSPRHYQNKGVLFLKHFASRGALLADDMRLGKTMQSVLAAKALGKKTLIVCPNFVRGVWEEEVKEWWPEANNVFLPVGTKPLLIEGNGIVIIHYDILPAWVDVLTAWAATSGGKLTLVIDECHALVNPKSQRSIACKTLRTHATYCWGTSGTPLPNHMSDMWNVVDTISPGRFGEQFFRYGQRYCDGHQEDIKFNAGGAKTTKTVWNFKGKSNEEELNRRLSYFMLRRTKTDVAEQLPPRIRQTLWVDIDSGKRKRRGSYFPESESKAAMRVALDKSADAKLPQVSKILQEHLASGKKVVCFTWRQHVAEGLASDAAEAGYLTGVAHGGVSALRRAKLFEDLKTKTEPLLLCATIDAAGVGIDLSWADLILFAELVWEPAKLLQAEARGFSLTSSRGLHIQYVLARGTADELVSRGVLSKFDMQEKVIGNLDAWDLRKDIEEKEEDVLKQLYEMMGHL